MKIVDSMQWNFWKADDVRRWREVLEKSWLRSAAALLVGILALIAIALDSYTLRFAAATVGVTLAGTHLVLIALFKVFIRRAARANQ